MVPGIDPSRRVETVKESVKAAVEAGGGILRLEPALVARDWLPPGRRLGLRDEEYDLG